MEVDRFHSFSKRPPAATYAGLSVRLSALSQKLLPSIVPPRFFNLALVDIQKHIHPPVGRQLDMSISSGSVGDIISISLIVKDLVKILDGSRGSTAQYREVIRDLWELDNLLLQVELVSRTYEQTAELNALCAIAKSIVQSCRECAEKFKESIKKYDSSLGMGNRRNAIVDVSMKIRWQVCHKDDLDKFRASVNAHCASLSILLSTATL